MQTYDLILNLAEDLIEKHQTNDPKIILKERGVFLIPFRRPTKLLGMYTKIKSSRFVLYNPNLSEQMLRMVFAHELGHDVLHQEEANEKHLHEFQLFDIKTRLETEANLFACHLLIDEKNLLSLGNSGYTYDQIAAKLGVNINLLFFKISELNRRGQKLNFYEPTNNSFFSKLNL